MAMRSVMLLGFTVPDVVARRLFAIDTIPTVQTHKFAWSFARALRSVSGKLVLASACPIQNFPLGRKIFFRGSRFEEQGIEGVLLGFVNLLVLKHFTRFIACLLVLPRLIVRLRVDWLFIHGSHTPFLLFGLLARLFGKKLGVVLTDPPGVVLPTDSVLDRTLKRVDVWLVTQTLAHVDIVIALAPELIKRYAVSKPALVFPGILNSKFFDQVARTYPLLKPDERFTIVYSGGLSRSYGVDRLLDAVRFLDGKLVYLKLFGRGELVKVIEELEVSDSRFKYGGFVGDDQLIPEMLAADLLVNPRPTQASYAVMSFPSKLIEYLTAGRPVLTTRISSIPESYRPYFFFIDNESFEGIRDAILAMMAMKSSERNERGLLGKAFISKEVSEKAIGQKISDLIRSIDPVG